MSSGMTIRRCRRAIREERVDDALFLIDEKEEAIHVLDTTASAIWHVIAEPIDRDEIVGLFEAAFPEVDGTAIERDIDGALTFFADAGLLASHRARSTASTVENTVKKARPKRERDLLS